MDERESNFAAAVRFHGHGCPGLALGFRVAERARRELGTARSEDEELVAVVENNSCAVDAIQLLTGCTFGKGNLLFHDYGKQVYTFFRRAGGGAVRIAVDWEPSPEPPAVQEAWERFGRGDRDPETIRLVQGRKAAKIKEILAAPDEELFRITHPQLAPPPPARIYRSLRCSRCGEKVMESRTREQGGEVLCSPCAEQ